MMFVFDIVLVYFHHIMFEKKSVCKDSFCLCVLVHIEGVKGYACYVRAAKFSTTFPVFLMLVMVTTS